jgi:hypothetical protein
MTQADAGVELLRIGELSLCGAVMIVAWLVIEVQNRRRRADSPSDAHEDLSARAPTGFAAGVWVR